MHLTNVYSNRMNFVITWCLLLTLYVANTQTVTLPFWAILIICHNLKQVVTCLTRRNCISNYIITNLKSFYKLPDIYAPLGPSDYNMILWTPKDIYKDNNNTCTDRTVCRYPQSALNGFGLWSIKNEWFAKLEPGL